MVHWIHQARLSIAIKIRSSVRISLASGGLVRFADPSPAPDLDNKPLAPPRRRVPQGSELKPLFHAIPQLLLHDIAAALAVFTAAWCAPKQDAFLW